jgi:hypothetical protein
MDVAPKGARGLGYTAFLPVYWPGSPDGGRCMPFGDESSSAHSLTRRGITSRSSFALRERMSRKGTSPHRLLTAASRPRNALGTQNGIGWQ